MIHICRMCSGGNMYHVSDNTRSVSSANKLYKSLLEIAVSKKVEKITIKQICDMSGVARTTFYRLFDDVEDILYWKCQNLFYKSLNIIEVDQFFQESDLIEPFFKYWAAHYKIIELLYSIKRIDIIYSSHQAAVKQLSIYWNYNNEDRVKYSQYFIPVRTSIVLSIMMTWIESGKKESIDELIDITKYHYNLLAKDEYVLEMRI